MANAVEECQTDTGEEATSNAYLSSAALHDWKSTLAGVDRFEDDCRVAVLGVIDRLIAENPERIELREYVATLERFGSELRPSAFAWATGQSIALPLGTDLGGAIAGCKSLGTALHWISQYFPLLQDASVLQLNVEQDWSTLSYKILDPTIWPRHEDAMYTLGIFSKMVRAASPEAWSQVVITVEAESDQVNADLESIVQAPVVYGGSTNSIRFPTSIINAPFSLAPPCDPSLLKKLSSDLSHKNRATPIVDRTRQMIFHEMNEGCVSQDHIARELGISSRTLRRRLSEENHSFQSLLDECRMQFAALEFKTRKRLSLSDMALKLGYSEHSTFSRAFARWAGMAPQEYRREVAAY